MSAMAMMSLTTSSPTTIEQTIRTTLSFQEAGTRLTWSSRARLNALLEQVPPHSMRAVTVTGIRGDVDGRHPTNFIVQQRANEIARLLLDAGVICGIVVDYDRAERFLGPRTGQVHLAVSYLN